VFAIKEGAFVVFVIFDAHIDGDTIGGSRTVGDSRVGHATMRVTVSPVTFLQYARARSRTPLFYNYLPYCLFVCIL
jgi:hypothetical protein